MAKRKRVTRKKTTAKKRRISGTTRTTRARAKRPAAKRARKRRGLPGGNGLLGDEYSYSVKQDTKQRKRAVARLQRLAGMDTKTLGTAGAGADTVGKRVRGPKKGLLYWLTGWGTGATSTDVNRVPVDMNSLGPRSRLILKAIGQEKERQEAIQQAQRNRQKAAQRRKNQRKKKGR